jgi:CcmD family protein
MIRLILLSLLLLLCNTFLFAQENGSGIANEMRSNGKIYVVVAVLTAIFIGIVIYLIRLDRKLSKLEKESKINH